MKTKHVFVPALDVGEILPFAVKKTKNVKNDLETQEQAKKELVRFIDKLEKNFAESIYYMGMDIIGEKAYERFLFHKGGFLEIMVEEPAAINAHFIDQKRAKKFMLALQKTIKQMILKSEMAESLIKSIEVQNEQDTSLSVEKWNIMKKIRSSE